MNNRKAAFTLASAALLLSVVYPVLLATVKTGNYPMYETVWQLPVSSISRIVIIENGEQLRFENTGQQGWVLAEPGDIPYEHAIAQALPLALANLAADKKVSEDPDSHSAYGLDDPVLIYVFLDDGSVRSVQLGGLSESGDSRYFSTGGAAVYTMGVLKSESLTLNALNVRDKNALGFNRTLRPSDIAARIDNIKVNGDARPELAEALARLTAEMFLGEGGFERYGLDYPRYVIEFTTENGAKTLYIGEDTPTGDSYYARTSDNEYVFTISRRGLDGLGADHMALPAGREQ